MGFFNDFGLGNLYKGAKSFLNPEKGYEKGQEQLNQYYNQGQSYQQPYFNQGQEAYGPYSNAMQNLLNPEELYGQWAQGYEQSPYAQQQQAAATQHALNAASAMGMLGSTPALNAMQAGNSAIGNADRENYFKRLMDMYFKGADIGQNIYGQGAIAANNLNQNAQNMGAESANMAFGKQNSPGAMMGGLLKALIGSGAGGGGGNRGWSTVG